MVSVCYGQEVNRPTVDSMDMKVFSMRELNEYLSRINTIAASVKNLKQPKSEDYKEIVLELNAISAEADRKRRKK